MLLKRTSQEVRPKTALTSYGFSDRLSAKNEVLIFDAAVLHTVLFHLKPQNLTLCELVLPLSSHRTISHLLDYRYYRQVNAWLRRQKHKMSHARRLSEDLNTKMAMFEKIDTIIVLPFLSIFVEECYL